MAPERSGMLAALSVIGRRWLIVGVSVVAFLALGIGVTLTTDAVYTAQSSVIVEPIVLQPSAASTGASLLDPQEVSTQGLVMASLPVAERVVADVGLDDDPRDLLDDVTVQVSGDTRVLSATVQRSSATEAAEIAHSFAASYLDYRRQQAHNALAKTRKALQSEAQGFRTAVSDLNVALTTSSGEELTRLQAQRQAAIIQLGQITTQLDVLDRNSGLAVRAGQILTYAKAPASPTSPKPVLNVVLAGLVGLVVGVGLAFIVESIGRERSAALRVHKSPRSSAELAPSRASRS